MSKLRGKIKNKAIEFWTFVLVIAMALYNFNVIGFEGELGKSVVTFSGGKVVDFFLILGGFYLVSSYKRLKKDKVKKISTWHYLRTNMVDLYPSIIGGVLIAFITRNYVAGTALIDIPKLFVGSIFELFGFAHFGVVPYVSAGNTAHLTNLITSGEISIIWNEPALYISATVLGGLFLFYLVSHHEDMFKSVACPLMIIVGFEILSTIDINKYFIIATLIRTIAGMAIGSLLYYFVEYFRKRKSNKYIKILLTLVYAILVIYFICSTVYGIEWSAFMNIAFIVPFMFVVLLEEDYFAALLNTKFSMYLGNLALYIFTSHIAFVYLIPYLLPDMSFMNMSLIYLIVCLIWGNIMYVFDACVITPLFREK